jgi:hypothetical protein
MNGTAERVCRFREAQDVSKLVGAMKGEKPESRVRDRRLIR